MTADEQVMADTPPPAAPVEAPPESSAEDWSAVFPELPPGELSRVLAALGRLEHAMRDVETNVAVLTEKLDRAEEQIGHVVELAAPAIEQISKSPLLKLLGGTKGGAKNAAG